jgi:type II restriction/modification system DNA methylase subunit YeeA
VVVWIGYLQWLHEHGMGLPEEPILRKLDNIQFRDAILASDAEGSYVESEWPNTDFIIGNPPFLGGKRLRSELGDSYVDALFRVYQGRVPPEADLVAYWFEKARGMIEQKRARRAGLLATQGIRGGANRKVLERIKESGDIFMAHSDRDWILDGAMVHVSIVGFDNGTQKERALDGESTTVIHPNLTSSVNTTAALPLPENMGLCFMGTTKIGDFDLAPEVATTILEAVGSPNGRPNSDVVKPWVNALDVTRRPRGMFIIDFGTDMPLVEAARYKRPFEYLRQHVYQERQKNNREGYKLKWWIHGEPRPEMRKALAPLKRFIATPAVAKHRLFTWLSKEILPDHAVFVFAREDDYFFGVLHSRPHEVWARAQGTQVREAESGFRYTPSSTFGTFPFPWTPGCEPEQSSLCQNIASAASVLVKERDAWINPAGASAEELKERTLTNLYNEYPTWLANAHRNLDEAVFAAYGWPASLTNSELLERLLLLNHQRSAAVANS